MMVVLNMVVVLTLNERAEAAFVNEFVTKRNVPKSLGVTILQYLQLQHKTRGTTDSADMRRQRRGGVSDLSANLLSARTQLRSDRRPFVRVRLSAYISYYDFHYRT